MLMARHLSDEKLSLRYTDTVIIDMPERLKNRLRMTCAAHNREEPRHHANWSNDVLSEASPKAMMNAPHRQ